jgi:hypothetical protein
VHRPVRWLHRIRYVGGSALKPLVLSTQQRFMETGEKEGKDRGRWTHILGRREGVASVTNSSADLL